ncbi:hypothetical protein [Stenotrophomonas sp. ZAC14A_NAIMI4_1]|jgi:hypothetical protein|uniref:hypothetical protein n=1 Tax=Stenotrophomonas sp. ZAC14A_NAIMI4_1 TaxID=2072412 RepID=UPI000D53DE59|nr:hypothetical protein [Stenotrophomonas sp. ZAC14A_NAIMI4_1]AWH46054.1 hypothetical protein C1926_13955 [Stenotrophomonas sp. ZAC14A_NAIMI4_1]
MNTTMAEGAAQRLVEQIGEALFSQSGLTLMELAEKVRGFSQPSVEQPDRKPAAWMTHHDKPMVFMTAAEAQAYCEDEERPIPLYALPGVLACSLEGVK